MADRVAAEACYARLHIPVEGGAKLIDDEGLSTVDDLAELTTERVKDIVATLRKPGGTIPNPGGRGAAVPNPGIYVPERAMHNLSVACFLCLMKERCARPFSMADIQLNDDLRAAGRQRDMEAKHRNSDDLLPPMTNKELGGRNFIEFTEEIIK